MFGQQELLQGLKTMSQITYGKWELNNETFEPFMKIQYETKIGSARDMLLALRCHGIDDPMSELKELMVVEFRKALDESFANKMAETHQCL